jgi:hypothetical protein
MSKASQSPLPTLASAIEWVRARWDDQRQAPLQLHEAHSVDGALGGLAFTPSFLAVLDGGPGDESSGEQVVECSHPVLQNGAEIRDCSECLGTGSRTIRVYRPKFPMTLALAKLRNALPMRRSFPHPAHGVVTLAMHNWDAQKTCEAFGLARETGEAYLLHILRMLHGRYQECPTSNRTYATRPTMRYDGPTWIDMSESQQNAVLSLERGAA